MRTIIYFLISIIALIAAMWFLDHSYESFNLKGILGNICYLIMIMAAGMTILSLFKRRRPELRFKNRRKLYL
jgi:hypothetical protein